MRKIILLISFLIFSNCYSRVAVNTDTRLIGLWHHDENTGTTVADDMGLHNGVATGAWVTGKYSYAMDYPDEPVSKPTTCAGVQVETASGTVCWWSNIATGATSVEYAWVIGGSATTYVGWYDYYPGWMVGGDVTKRFNQGGDGAGANAQQLKDSTWHFYALTWETTEGQQIYRDGVFLWHQKNGMWAAGTTATNLYIGGDGGTVSGCGGYIDEFQVYNTNLTTATILDLYNESAVVIQRKKRRIGLIQVIP